MSDESGTESGKEFREKFEATAAEAKAAKEALASVYAEQYSVSVKDLLEFSPTEMASKAEELQKQAQAQKEQTLREALAAQGLDGDNLEEAVAKLTGTKPAEKPTASPFSTAGQLPSQPIGSAPEQNIRGRKRIEAALSQVKN